MNNIFSMSSIVPRYVRKETKLNVGTGVLADGFRGKVVESFLKAVAAFVEVA